MSAATRTKKASLLLLFVGCFLMVSGVVAAGATTDPGNPNQGCDESHHSDTGHGANQSGAYDSTCDGSPSENGNGDGAATGRPCAGCVGNADDKNPPGQYPDGSDPNNGYECDGNSGIGKTNPAHTGCTTSVAVVPTPTPPPAVTVVTTPAPTPTPFTPPGQVKTPPPPPPFTPPGQVKTPPPPKGPPTAPPPAGTVPPPTVPPTVLPSVLTPAPENPEGPPGGTRQASPPPAVAAVQTPQGETLPFTGDRAALPLMAAGLLLAAGGALMLVTGRATA